MSATHAPAARTGVDMNANYEAILIHVTTLVLVVWVKMGRVA